MKPVRLGNTANAGCCKGGTDGEDAVSASLLRHHGQFTRLGLRACERQPWLEERVDTPHNRALTLINSSVMVRHWSVLGVLKALWR